MTKEEFLQAKANAPINQVLQESIAYKRTIQFDILPLLTKMEVYDIHKSRKNEGVIDKLCQLGALQMHKGYGFISIYACAMAIATIIKEYEWGLEYLKSDGLYELVTRIENKISIAQKQKISNVSDKDIKIFISSYHKRYQWGEFIEQSAAFRNVELSFSNKRQNITVSIIPSLTPKTAQLLFNNGNCYTYNGSGYSFVVHFNEFDEIEFFSLELLARNLKLEYY